MRIARYVRSSDTVDFGLIVFTISKRSEWYSMCLLYEKCQLQVIFHVVKQTPSPPTSIIWNCNLLPYFVHSLYTCGSEMKIRHW